LFFIVNSETFLKLVVPNLDYEKIA
jgi:hypothetical protein